MNHDSSAEDSALLERLAQGDLEALAALYDRYAPPVYHLLLAQTSDPEAAADLLQETFLALLDRGRGARSIRSLRAYLLGVAQHLASRDRRRRRREVGLEETDLGAAAPESPGTTVQVQRALAALPPEQAAVVVLKVWHDLTFREIAEALGLSPDTVASRYRYAAEKLRRLLGDEEE
ncbi:MAG TPA: RNA polymerase sigma factor [Armatimonadota bacterium]|jgi:RNA polymerase sigma-70 factor (ECF subfamily)